MNFETKNFDKRTILFSTGFAERPRHAFITLRSLMATILLDFSVTQAQLQNELFLFC